MLEPNKNRAYEETSCWKKRSRLEKKLIFFIILVGLIATLFLILYFTKRSCSISEEECTDENCVKASAELLEFIDLKQNPCNNFYAFACGHYLKDAVKKDSSTPLLQINTEYLNEMKSLVVDPIRRKDSNASIAMKQFYHACMNEKKIDEENDEVFLTTVNELGGWPLINTSNWDEKKFDWIEWHLKAVKLGVPFIGIFDFKNADSSDNITILRVAGSPLSDISVKRSKYEIIMNKIAKNFNASAGFGSENIEVYDFIQKIKKLTKDIQTEDDLDENITTIKHLYENCPQFPWLKIINGLSGSVRVFKNDTKIMTGTIAKYCEGVDNLIKVTPKRNIANYYIWSILKKSHVLMGDRIRSVFSSLDKAQEDRFDTCYDLTNEKFKYLKETVYIRKKTKPEVREKISILFNEIIEVFTEHLKKSTWMDEETRERAVEKAELIEKVIGAEDILYDTEKFDRILGFMGLSFTSDDAFQILKEKTLKENEHMWDMMYDNTPENWKAFFDIANNVNAFFAQALNLMIIPAPILNSVFFNHKMPSFMNYGSLGRVIGHEIMHGFGEDGRQVILENDDVIDWWTNATAENFNVTKQCAIKEYESIPFRYKLNGTITLEENLADLVGIDIAYEAYEKWVAKNGEEKKLPGIPLTPKQIFWIQTGTFLCFRKLDDETIDLEDKDVHAIPIFRVNAGARHSKYFAKDFNCPKGSFMNPEEKCRIL